MTINPDLTTDQTLSFTASSDAGINIDWEITKEGDDVSSYTFTRATVDRSYYQELSINLTSDSITLENNTDYILSGFNGTSLVFKGKLHSTNQTLSQYALNTYEERVDNNTYITYD